MNKSFSRVIAFALCAVLCLSGVFTAYASASGEEITAEISKNETVYILTNADGATRKIIVSDWLNNQSGLSSIHDITCLSDIENVKGNENWTIQDEALVWNAEGNDIYYQGTTENELPVNLSVTYQIDGKYVPANEVAGKSGSVCIRFDYENSQYETVLINEKEENIYVPFAVVTGMLLDNSHFRNVEVKNGKLINDGDHTVVVGFAFPGMQDSLGLSKDQIDIPDCVEITADVTDFTLGMTVTIATNEPFSTLDASKLDSVDGLKDSISELSDGMDQLLVGSSSLYDGLNTLLEKSEELVSGIDQLADGSATLSDGLTLLKENNEALNGGAKQVFEALLLTAETQLRAAGIPVPALTIDNYVTVLDEVISSLDESAVYQQALMQVTAAVEENRPLIAEKVTAAVREEIESQVSSAVRSQVSDQVTSAVMEQVSEKVIMAAAGVSKADYEAAVAAELIPNDTQDAIIMAIDTQMQSDEIMAMIEETVKSQIESDEIKAAINANTEAQMQTATVQEAISAHTEEQIQQLISDNMASDEVQAKMSAAAEGAKTVTSLKESLDNFNSFYLGLLSYTEGVASAADGAAILSSGISDLKKGIAGMDDDNQQVENGTPTLIDGISQLKDGALQLSGGLKKFDEEGIQKIVGLVDSDLNNIVERLKAIIRVSEHYNNFSGIDDAMNGQVKFIYRTDEINQ